MIAPFSDHRLPRGRHGLDPEQVAANQRWRLLGAAGTVLAERGYLGTTVRGIATRAGVSVSTFYVHFDSAAAVLSAAVGVAADSLYESLAGELDPPPGRGLKAALEAALGHLRREPDLAYLLGPGLAVADAGVAAERQRLIGGLAAVLSGCEGARLRQPSRRAATELLVAAALAVALQAQVPGSPSAATLSTELAQLLGVVVL